MTVLPPLIRRVPTILYVAAALFFIASILLNHFELESTMEFARSHDPIVRSARLRAIYQGGLDAAFLAANGVIVHVLLAIWHNGLADPGDRK
jgi:hypothetical protein